LQGLQLLGAQLQPAGLRRAVAGDDSVILDIGIGDEVGLGCALHRRHLLRLHQFTHAHRTQFIDPRLQHRAGIKDIHKAFVIQTFLFQQSACRFGGGVDFADHVLRYLGQIGHIQRMTRHD